MKKPHIRRDLYRPGGWICTYTEETKFCNLLTHGTGRTPTEAYDNCIKRLLKS